MTNYAPSLKLYQTIYFLLKFDNPPEDSFLGVYEDRFLSEFQRLKSISVLHIVTKDLEVVLRTILNGNCALDQSELFDQINTNCQDIVKNGLGVISDRALATRIHILSLLLHGDYFIHNTASDVILENSCEFEELFRKIDKFAFHPFVDQEIIQSALQKEFSPANVFSAISGVIIGQGGHIDRHVVLQEIAAVNLILKDISGRKLDVICASLDMEKTCDIQQVKPVVLSHGRIICFAVSTDKIYCGCADNSVKIFDLSNMREIGKLQKNIHKSSIVHMSYNSKTDHIVVVTSPSAKETDYNAYLWCNSNNILSRRIRINHYFSSKIAISDNYFMSLGYNAIHFFNMSDNFNEVPDTFMKQEYSEFYVTSFIAHKNKLYLTHPKIDGTVYNYIMVYDLDTLAQECVFKGLDQAVDFMVANGERLYSTTREDLYVWDINTKTLLWKQKHSVGNKCNVVFWNHGLYLGNHEGAIVEYYHINEATEPIADDGSPYDVWNPRKTPTSVRAVTGAAVPAVEYYPLPAEVRKYDSNYAVYKFEVTAGKVLMMSIGKIFVRLL